MNQDEERSQAGRAKRGGAGLGHLRELPELGCDLVMKGGVTSGVVYPRAILELAEKYRLCDLGGTSAGAIAAGFAAAAEYGRKTGGYERLSEVADELPEQLQHLFQPAPEFRPFFELLLDWKSPGVRRRRLLALAGQQLRVRWRTWGLGLLAGALFGAAGGLLMVLLGQSFFSLWLTSPLSWGNTLLLGAFCGALCGLIVGAVLGYFWSLVGAVRLFFQEQLPARFFGVCPGKTQAGQTTLGLTDWMHRELNRISGLNEPGVPLTFRHLEQRSGAPDEHAIGLEVLTTSLSEGRPYRLPFSQARFFFNRAEFEQLFPLDVVEYLVKKGKPAKTAGFFQLPEGEELPVVVAIRMSLSFPLLLASVPLYAADYTLLDKEQHNELRRVVFSDGGISSNFPIHFFDEPLPRRPTFAINLEQYDPERHGENYVALPESAKDGIVRQINDIESVGEFLGGVFHAMQNWQDNLRLQQPGTRERVVTVRLAADQGGLNLKMDSSVVQTLIERGELAGQKLRDGFNFDEHRWKRYLVWSGALEEAFQYKCASYYGWTEGEAEAESTESYAEFLAQYEPQSYKPKSQAWKRDVLQRTEQLMALVREQEGKGETPRLQGFMDKDVPQPRPKPLLRLLPKQ